jgi:hypothetical protein
LLSVILLPLAIQTIHAFKKHEYLVSNKQVSINLYDEEPNCSVFHFKINHNSIDFNSVFVAHENSIFNNKIYTLSNLNYGVLQPQKSSRAPPYLML